MRNGGKMGKGNSPNAECGIVERRSGGSPMTTRSTRSPTTPRSMADANRHRTTDGVNVHRLGNGHRLGAVAGFDIDEPTGSYRAHPLRECFIRQRVSTELEKAAIVEIHPD